MLDERSVQPLAASGWILLARSAASFLV